MITAAFLTNVVALGVVDIIPPKRVQLGDISLPGRIEYKAEVGRVPSFSIELGEVLCETPKINQFLAALHVRYVLRRNSGLGIRWGKAPHGRPLRDNHAPNPAYRTTGNEEMACRIWRSSDFAFRVLLKSYGWSLAGVSPNGAKAPVITLPRGRGIGESLVSVTEQVSPARRYQGFRGRLVGTHQEVNLQPGDNRDHGREPGQNLSVISNPFRRRAIEAFCYGLFIGACIIVGTYLLRRRG